jgi:hypothetical protein
LPPISSQLPRSGCPHVRYCWASLPTRKSIYQLPILPFARFYCTGMATRRGRVEALCCDPEQHSA